MCFFMVGIYISPASAQQFQNLEEGDRIRISTPVVKPNTITGTVSILDGSVVALSVKDSLVYVSESLVQNVEISTGKRRVIGRGMLIGAVSGLLLSGLINSYLNDACRVGEDCIFANSNGEAFIRGGTTGLIFGGLSGAIAGFFIRIDRWKNVPVGVAMDVSPILPDQKKLEPKLSLRFSF